MKQYRSSHTAFRIASRILAGTLAVPVALGAMPQCMQAVFAQDQMFSQLNLLTYEVSTSQGERVSTWKSGRKNDVRMVVKNAGFLTSDVVPAEELKYKGVVSCIDVDMLHCGFTCSNKPEVRLLSKAHEQLKIEITFLDVKWNGENNELSVSIGAPKTGLPYETVDVEVTQCVIPQSEPDTPPDPVVPNPQPEPQPDPGDMQMPDETPPSDNQDDEDDGNESIEPEVKPAAAAPNLIIEKYTYGGQSVEAGSTFPLTIEFINTSKTHRVENIVMSVQTAEGLSITNASNTSYFESLGPRKTLSKTLDIRALGTEQSSSPTITVSFQYDYIDNNVRSERTSSETLSIPVYQADRFELTAPETPVGMMPGMETPLSFPYVNKGKDTLYNVTASIEGDMESLLKVQNLGNFEPGKSGSIDMILLPEKGGERKFKVLITYENANGEEIRKEFPYTVAIEEGLPVSDLPLPGEDPGMYVDPIAEESSSGSLWIWIAAAAGAAALGAFIWWKRRKKKGRKSKDDFDDFFAQDDPFASMNENPDAGISASISAQPERGEEDWYEDESSIDTDEKNGKARAKADDRL